MTKVAFVTMCDYAFPDHTGKACVIGMFEEIHTSAFPARHAAMSLYARLTGEPGDHAQITVEAGRPNGDILKKMETSVTLNRAGFGNLMVRLEEFLFVEAGRYVFKVLLDGKTAASVSLRVSLRADGGPTETVH